MTPNHEHFAEAAAGYALGALPDEERRAFENHLDGCADCQRDVTEFARVTEGLPQTLALEPLPFGLRARVVATATAGPRQVPQNTAPIGRAPAARPLLAWLAAAASIAAVVAGALAFNGWREAAELRAALSRAQQQGEALERQIAALQESANQAREANAVLGASDLARVDLAGQAEAPIATGRVLWSQSQGLVFVATNLPALPPGRVYQLWVVADKPLSAGVVVADAGGRMSVVNAGPVAGPPKAFALTVEPEGGRPSPTGPMVLVGKSD
jgi:anti-sigma-K factor RskA